MLLKFYGQTIFNSDMQAVGIEMLLRGVNVRSNGTIDISLPVEIFSLPEFRGKYYHAVDMLALGAVSSYSNRIRATSQNLKYIFINVSDSSLKDLLAYGANCLIFKMFKSISKSIFPLKLVVEIHEHSLIDAEGAVRVINLLREAKILVAQDDYEASRQAYIDSAKWDFIKKNASENLSCSYAFEANTSIKIIERATFKDVESCPNYLFQGFDLHTPEDLGCLLNKLANK